MEITMGKLQKDVAYKKKRQREALMYLAKYEGKGITFANHYIIGMLKTGHTPQETLELGTHILRYNPYFEDPDPETFLKKKMERILEQPVVQIYPGVDEIAKMVG